MILSAQIERALYEDGLRTNERSFAIGFWSLLSRADAADLFVPGLLAFIQSCGIPFDDANFCTARSLLGQAFAHITHHARARGERADTYLAIGAMDYFPDANIASGNLTRHSILLAPVWENERIIPLYIDPRPAHGLVQLSAEEKSSCERYLFR
jgi:hypothetical protein